MRRLLTLLLILIPLPASAVVVSGTVFSPLGRPVPGARVQLIDLTQTTQSAADAVSGLDGTYELRSDRAGRFLLLTTSASFAPQIGLPFYAGRTDALNQDITLNHTGLTPQQSTLPLGQPTPQSQLAQPTTQLSADDLLTHDLLAHQLALSPGAFLFTAGQQGQQATLYLHGASPNANAVLLDGIPIQNLGARFNFGPISTTGLSALELSPGPNPLDAPQSEAATIALTTPQAPPGPTLLYAGDAGNLHTWHNELAASIARSRADLFATASRLDTSNALPNDRFHNETAALNAGYFISANTSLRFTGRAEFIAAPLPIPYDLGLSPLTRDAEQNLLTSATFDTRTQANWHNLLRLALVRRREQVFDYLNPPARQVTLRAANGFSATGQPTLPALPAREDQATNRDLYTYQTDYPIKPWLQPFFSATVQQERALDQIPLLKQSLTRTNLTLATSIRGQIHHRLFYETAADLNHATLLGFTGNPRLGLTYIPVQQGTRRLRGTTLHLTAATGSREPSLQEQAQRIFTSPRSRTVAFSADQTILRTLSLSVGYFHNQFSHQPETLALTPQTIAQDQLLSGTQAFRTQGLDLSVSYRPFPRLSLNGAYTYLAALVEQTATQPTFNPNLPTTPIGATAPLLGARPFHRPPHTGSFNIAYTGKSLSANLQASLAGRSDDSTRTTLTPTFLLPNRNLDFGFTRLDASVSYQLTRRTTLYTQLANLLNDQHIGPIGYPSTPFTVRSGLRFRLGSSN